MIPQGLTIDLEKGTEVFVTQAMIEKIRELGWNPKVNLQDWIKNKL